MLSGEVVEAVQWGAGALVGLGSMVLTFGRPQPPVAVRVRTAVTEVAVFAVVVAVGVAHRLDLATTVLVALGASLVVSFAAYRCDLALSRGTGTGQGVLTPDRIKFAGWFDPARRGRGSARAGVLHELAALNAHGGTVCFEAHAGEHGEGALVMVRPELGAHQSVAVARGDLERLSGVLAGSADMDLALSVREIDLGVPAGLRVGGDAVVNLAVVTPANVTWTSLDRVELLGVVRSILESVAAPAGTD